MNTYMSSHTEWIEIPECVEANNLPDSICWNDNEILLKYDRDNRNVVIKSEEHNYSQFKDIISKIRSDKYFELFIQLSNLISDTDSFCQFGSFDNSIDKRFNYKCVNCDDGSTFQIKGRYRGKHASCISCGENMSIIEHNCPTCSRESIFIKPHADVNEFYECHRCGSEIP